MAPPLLPHGPELMHGFRKQGLKTSGAQINVAIAGEGPPLLLLHGNPLTLVSWHKLAPSLAQSFTVVATDLRGYGDSSKPEGGSDHAAYTFRARAISTPPSTGCTRTAIRSCALLRKPLDSRAPTRYR